LDRRQAAPFVKGSSCSRLVEFKAALEAELYSLSFDQFFCLCFFYLLCGLLFLFNFSLGRERWNCMELYVCHEFVFCLIRSRLLVCLSRCMRCLSRDDEFQRVCLVQDCVYDINLLLIYSKGVRARRSRGDQSWLEKRSKIWT